MFCVWYLHSSRRESILKRSVTEEGILGVLWVDLQQVKNTGFKSKVITQTQGGWGRKGLSRYSPRGQAITGRQM